jgi:predicted RNA-binding protein
VYVNIFPIARAIKQHPVPSSFYYSFIVELGKVLKLQRSYGKEVGKSFTLNFMKLRANGTILAETDLMVIVKGSKIQFMSLKEGKFLIRMENIIVESGTANYVKLNSDGPIYIVHLSDQPVINTCSMNVVSSQHLNFQNRTTTYLYIKTPQITFNGTVILEGVTANLDIHYLFKFYFPEIPTTLKGDGQFIIDIFGGDKLVRASIKSLTGSVKPLPALVVFNESSTIPYLGIILLATISPCLIQTIRYKVLKVKN